MPRMFKLGGLAVALTFCLLAESGGGLSLYHERLASKSQTETEIKLSVPNAAAARRLLRRAGFAVATKRHFERNIMVDTRPPSLKPSGQLLRIRQAAGATILTYKGPAATNTKHKSREEIETQAGPAIQTILAKLGFVRTFSYEKYRTEFAQPGKRGLAVLDETPIGVFLELEGTPAWIDRTARALGFSEERYILQSYGSLWAEHCRQRQLPPADFVFPRRTAPSG